VLAKNFGVPAQTFANFPTREVYIAKGPVPPPLPSDPAASSLNAGALTHRYRLLAQRPDTFAGGTLGIVSKREFPISTTMTGALMRIRPGALRELHWHPNADEWQYYAKGRARMTVSARTHHPAEHAAASMACLSRGRQGNMTGNG
jgi:oxalate decarboxylase